MEEKIESSQAEPEWAALAAIDWANQKHYFRLQPCGGPVEQGEMENTPEAVDQWAMGLYVRFSARPIALILEQSRGSLVILLSKYSHLVLYPVHPKTAAQYRETFAPSGAKSDPGDTASLLDLLERHREQLRKLQPDTAQTRLLQILVEGRRQLVDEKTRQKNRLTACLKLYFPQLLQWFDSVDSALVCDLIEKWGHLAEMKKDHPGTLNKFLRDHNCHGEERNQERIALIYKAVAATEDPAIVEGETQRARSLAAVVTTLRKQIAVFDRRIEELVAEHPDGSLFASLPGAGPALVPRLIVAFGTQRERYESGFQMQCFSGIAPVTEKSGKSKWVHYRKACPKFLRQTFHEFAGHSIQSSEWAEAYYQFQKDNHKSHHAAVRALAGRWIRVIFRCWKDRQPYDEKIYQESLRRHHSPVIKGGKWKNVGGLKKFCIDPS